MRSVLRMEEPSVRREIQSTALSMSWRMAPNGRTGMIPKVERHALHLRRGLPSLSFPQPIVGPPQERQLVGLGVGVEASIASASIDERDQKDIHRLYTALMADRPRKHTEAVILRFEPEHLDLVDRAATQAGLNRTAWLRALAIRMAREELQEGGKGEGKA
jgi:hypothetical protein